VGSKTCIVVFDASLGGEKTELGLMVDAVSEVIEIAPGNIDPPPQFGTTVERQFIQGMGKVDGEFIVVLDAERVLNIDDMTQLIAPALMP
jgi:purine-binding chemotaxis protein CheW